MFKTGSDEYKAYRCEKKFECYYGGARPFRLLKQEVQEPILMQASLSEGEIPVYGQPAPLGWILVTTRRVIWKENESVNSLAFAEMRRAGWSAGPKAVGSRVDPSAVDMHWINENGEKVLTKLSSPWLFLCDVHGTRHELYLQPNELPAVMDRILYLRNLERSYPRD